MAISRVTAVWTGMPGAPGYTNFHFSPFTGGGDAQAAVDRVRAFFLAISSVIPTQVSIQVSGTVETIDETTGTLTGYQDVDEPRIVTGTGSASNFVGPSGAVINWLTSTVRAGRRVHGRTFLVPLRTGAFDADGTLGSAALTTIRGAADTLVGGDFEQQMVVWARPVGGTGGLAAPIIGSRVPDLAAVLRSRRD